MSNPRGAIVNAFDDAYPSTQIAYDILQPAGIKATIPTPTGAIDAGNLLGVEVMDWAALDAMVAGGWELTNHSVTHTHMTELDDAGIEAEVNGARDALLARGYGNEGHLHYVCPAHFTSTPIRRVIMRTMKSNRDTSTSQTIPNNPIPAYSRNRFRSFLYTVEDIPNILTLMDNAIAQGKIAMCHTHGGGTEWEQIADHIVSHGYVNDCYTMTGLFQRYEYLWNRTQPLFNARAGIPVPTIGSPGDE